MGVCCDDGQEKEVRALSTLIEAKIRKNKTGAINEGC
jgi:hypothetical protein